MSSHTACMNMIKQQLHTNNILDETILNLYETIHRDDFVPNDMQSFAYTDMQIPLPHGQCMMTPLEEASLLQALCLTGSETVLEVGTGTGFLTCLLSALSKQVISIDQFPDFTVLARHNLTQYATGNVELFTGDACRGWIDKAPYDVMVFTGAMNTLTETHRLQLLPGGKLFAIVGKAPIMEAQLHRLNHDKTWKKEVIFETNIPPLIDKLRPEEFVF